MKRTERGGFQIDPTPEIAVYVNRNGHITISIDEEVIEIPREYAEGIGKAILTLDSEIKAGDWDSEGDEEEKEAIRELGEEGAEG